MIRHLLLVCVLLLTINSGRAASLVARAEATELRTSGGSILSRVERDDQGNITSLRLNDMQLSQEDFEELGRLDHLRRLVLYRSKFSGRDVAGLERCKSLEHLNLTSTEVTDDVIDAVLKLKKLRTLCLGDVNITSSAVERLKDLNRERDKIGSEHLRWGYSQRSNDRK